MSISGSGFQTQKQRQEDNLPKIDYNPDIS